MRAAASLVLVRDGRPGLEVLLLKRGEAGDFPGLHVFPGGLVDAADGDARLIARSRRSAADADALLAGGDALPGFIAALRECLEEAGILLTDVPVSATQRAGWQDALHARNTTFADLLANEPLQLATDKLGYLSHWITPAGIPRRYDTRFFVAVMPADQEVRIDGREAVHADWYTPAAALTAHERGEIGLIFPTIHNLTALKGFSDSATLLRYAQKQRPRPAMLPRIVNTPEGVRLLLPGDAGYDA